jgi:hypothetical protein
LWRCGRSRLPGISESRCSPPVSRRPSLIQVRPGPVSPATPGRASPGSGAQIAPGAEAANTGPQSRLEPSPTQREPRALASCHRGCPRVRSQCRQQRPHESAGQVTQAASEARGEGGRADGRPQVGAEKAVKRTRNLGLGTSSPRAGPPRGPPLPAGSGPRATEHQPERPGPGAGRRCQPAPGPGPRSTSTLGHFKLPHC